MKGEYQIPAVHFLLFSLVKLRGRSVFSQTKFFYTAGPLLPSVAVNEDRISTWRGGVFTRRLPQKTWYSTWAVAARPGPPPPPPNRGPPNDYKCVSRNLGGAGVGGGRKSTEYGKTLVSLGNPACPERAGDRVQLCDGEASKVVGTPQETVRNWPA